MIRRALLPLVPLSLLALALIVAACDHGGPTDPDISATLGTLSGSVSIGPNCPGSQSCSTPPEAYAARKIAVYDAAHTKLLHTLDINSQGLYVIKLVPATYIIELGTSSAADRTNDLPKTVTITRGAVTNVNVTIDTGLR